MCDGARGGWPQSSVLCVLLAAGVAVVGGVQLRAAQGAPVLAARLAAPDGSPGDRFGESIALGRDWLAVGAPGRDVAGTDSGAVYLFRRDGGGWAFDSMLTASGALPGDAFGHAVALDGGTLLVGAWRADGPAEDTGAAYVFTLADGQWSEQAVLVAPDAAEGDGFGQAVTVCGSWAAVGAPARADAAASIGAVYLLASDEGAWGHAGTLLPPQSGEDQYFGCSMAMEAGRLLLGARGDGDRGINAGQAYLYTRDGAQWSPGPALIGSATEQGDKLGWAVAVDGERAVLCAPGENPAGAAYVFERGPGPYAEAARLAVGGTSESDGVGASGACDGRAVAVGAPGDDEAGRDRGAVYLFSERDGTWEPVGKALPLPNAEDGAMGFSVALRDGCLAAGAPGDAEAGDVGAVYVYAAGLRTVWHGPNGGTADWTDANCWTAGRPAAGMNVEIGSGSEVRLCGVGGGLGELAIGTEEPGTLRLTGATLAADTLILGPHGTLLLDANSVLDVGGLAIEAGGRIALAGGTVYYGQGEDRRALVVGDVDLDGSVTGTDLDVLEAHFARVGSTGWPEGDVDADGRVGPSDYLTVKQGLDGPAAPPSAPEPATAWLLALVTVAAARRRRRRVRR